MIPIITLPPQSTPTTYDVVRQGLTDYVVRGDGIHLVSLMTDVAAESIRDQLQALQGQVDVQPPTTSLVIYRCYDRTHLHTYYRVIPCP